MGPRPAAWLGGVLVLTAAAVVVEGNWCIARSGASSTQLQTALDYACGAGADCAPIQPSGLCYLPNTLPAHASYAFNSYYQRSNLAPGACDFAGSATATITDPSYGSCTFPSSPSTAGGSTSGTPSTPGNNTPPNTPTNAPNLGGTPVFGNGGAGGLTPGAGGLTPGFGPPTVPDDDSSEAPPLHHFFLLSTVFLSLPILIL